MMSEVIGGDRTKRLVKGAAVAAASFAGLGTVSALWDNPLFIRMTPAGGWEVGLLAALSLLLGAYVWIRRPACSVKAAGAGSVLGFHGIACTVCNKVLLLLFGGELMLTYYEQCGVDVAAVGVIPVLAALLRAWLEVRQVPEAMREDATVPVR